MTAQDKVDRRPGAKAGADVILIRKSLRMEWVDAMAFDTDLSPLAFRVACVIGAHFNQNSGSTFVGHLAIARGAGLGVTTIKKAIAELEQRGYLVVERRELGARRSDGRRACGGRGAANTYKPAFETSQLSALSDGGLMRHAVTARLEAAVKEPPRRLQTDEQSSREADAKEPPGRLATLPSSKEEDGELVESARARLDRFGKALVDRIGEFLFVKWFCNDQVTVQRVGDVLIMLVPNKHSQHYIKAHFLEHIIAVRQSLHSSIERVEVTVRS